MSDALLFAAIGPNPASVAEAIWALVRQRDVRIVEAHLVSLARGHYWLAEELLGEHGAVADLCAVLPGVLPSGDASVIKLLTVRADGAAVEDDRDEADAALYQAAIWDAARSCVERAGSRPVIFLLAGGRQRTMTAYAVAVYQLLARAQDELLDVRVSDRRAEGGSGFFFPEQQQQHLLTDQGVLDARTVQVSLVPVAVPRLAGLIAAEHRTSFEAALEASRQAIEAMSPPRLTIDLLAGVARVNGEVVPFTAGQLVWYGLLAVKRVADGVQGPGEVPADATELLAKLMSPISKTKWVARGVRDYTVRSALGLEMIHGEAVDSYSSVERLSKLRADTRKTMSTWLQGRVRPAWDALLVPEKSKRAGETFQRIALSPEYIDVAWPA